MPDLHCFYWPVRGMSVRCDITKGRSLFFGLILSDYWYKASKVKDGSCLKTQFQSILRDRVLKNQEKGSDFVKPKRLQEQSGERWRHLLSTLWGQGEVIWESPLSPSPWCETHVLLLIISLLHGEGQRNLPHKLLLTRRIGCLFLLHFSPPRQAGWLTSEVTTTHCSASSCPPTRRTSFLRFIDEFEISKTEFDNRWDLNFDKTATSRCGVVRRVQSVTVSEMDLFHRKQFKKLKWEKNKQTLKN